MSGEVGSNEHLNEVDAQLPSCYTGSFTRGSRYGQRQDELLQSMSSRYQAEYQNRRSYEMQAVETDPDESVQVDMCNFHNIENAERHNSNMYEIVQNEPSKPVYRRGLPFKMTIKFKNRGFDSRTDTAKLILNFGPNPSIPKETKIILPLAYERQDRDVELLNYWEAIITRCDRVSMDIEVYIPPDAPVGVWRCWIETCRRRISRRDKPTRPRKLVEENPEKSKIKVQIRDDSKERKKGDLTQTEDSEETKENRCKDQIDDNKENTETVEEEYNRQYRDEEKEDSREESDTRKEDHDKIGEDEERKEEDRDDKDDKETYKMDYSPYPRMFDDHRRDAKDSEEDPKKDEESASRSGSQQQEEQRERYFRRENMKDNRNEEEKKRDSNSRSIPKYDPSSERMRGRRQRETSPNAEGEREDREGSARNGIQRQERGPYRPDRGQYKSDRPDEYQRGYGSRPRRMQEDEDPQREDRDGSPQGRSQERPPWQRRDDSYQKERNTSRNGHTYSRPSRSHSGYHQYNEDRDYPRDSNDRSKSRDYYDGRNRDGSKERHYRRLDSHDRKDRDLSDDHRRSRSGFEINDPFRERGICDSKRHRGEEGSPKRSSSFGEERHQQTRNRYDSSGRRARDEEEGLSGRHGTRGSYNNNESRRHRNSPERPSYANDEHGRPRSMGRSSYEDNKSHNEPQVRKGHREPGRGGKSQNEDRGNRTDRGNYRRGYGQGNGHDRSRSRHDMGYQMEQRHRYPSKREDGSKGGRAYSNGNRDRRDFYSNERCRSHSPTRRQDERFDQNGSSRGRDYLDRSSSRHQQSRSPYSTDRRQHGRRHSFDDGREKSRSEFNRYQDQSSENYSNRKNPNPYHNRYNQDDNRPWWRREGRQGPERGPTRRFGQSQSHHQKEEAELQDYEETKELFKCDDDIYILFNPWCNDDPTFMENEKWRREYVLNDTGKVWVGTYNNPVGRRWVYGQFDDAVLPAVMYLLEEARMSGNDRANPVRVCRAISEMVNNRDSSSNSNERKNNGFKSNCVMDGRWDGNYDDGFSPYSWAGSSAILEQYLRTGKPVKYGQCWVFSALTTTICRALGIPCRSVTNFVSAHDTNNSLCIDKYFNCTGDEIEGGPDGDTWDSVWSFHSWNDAWMERSDLPSGYGGWQAFDPTFQEENDGLYKCGPASLQAIRRGEIGFSFDTPFIFTEINSEINHWQQDNKSEWGFCKVKPHKYGVGQCILTKRPDRDDDEGDDDVQNVIDEYRTRHGNKTSKEHVMSQLRGMDRVGPRRDESRKSRREDVEIELEEMRKVKMGGTVIIRMKMSNRSREQRTVDAMMSCNAVYYTGVVRNSIKQEKREVLLQPNSSEIFTLQVKSQDYNDKLVDYALMKIYASARVRETRQNWSDEDDFSFQKPMIQITVGEKRRVGEYLEVKLEFSNPLNVTLSNCRLSFECPFVQRATSTKFRDVGPNERITFTELFLPREEGCSKIVAAFSSHQLNELNGATNIFINK